MPPITTALSAAIAPRYVIERELGAGGMAIVFLARDLKHNRPVALKVLRPELAAIIGGERFLKEIEVTAALQHPHILPLYDSGEAEGFLYYVMPFLEGETLRARLQREKQIDIDEAVRIAVAVAGALDCAHRRGVLHRDIKPENILLHDGQPLVMDFGIALALSQAGGARLTETGLSLGTPHYMSPEQAMGDRELDARSDVYSLGATLYEMLIGDPPHTGSTAQAIVAKVITERPVPAVAQRDTVPMYISDATQKALSKLPADRFRSAGEFAHALVTPAAPTLGRTTPSRAAALGGAPAWRAATLVGAATLLLGGAAGWLLHPRPPAPSLGRFTMELEPATTLTGGQYRPFAISPDGGAIAFVGLGERQQQIYLRGMADSVPRAIAGTEDGEAPFFSPSGREVGFTRRGRLERVPIEGGAPTLIADSAAPAAAWLDDGTVAFVSPDGSELRQASFAQRPRTIARNPDWRIVELSSLPGSRYVLAELIVRRASRRSVVAISLRDGTVRDVGLGDAIVARHTRGDMVVYQLAAGGPLMAARFDLRRLTVVGERRAVAPEQGLFFGLWPQWDAAGSAIVYFQRPGMRLVLTDRTGHETPLLDEARSYHHPRFSPDGRRVAVDISEPGARDIWVVDVRDGRMSRLTVNEWANDPYWSPDGSRIAYTTQRAGGLRSIFARNTDGSGGADSVFGDGHDHSSGAWTPDGRTLVVSTALTAGLWTIDIAHRTGTAIEGSRTSESAPALSPDGRWLAYVSLESGQREVYVRPFPGPGGREQVSVNGGAEPVWSHDGHELFYREEQYSGGRMVAAKVLTAPRFAVLSRTPLFDARAYDRVATDHANYDVSPDGLRFLLVRGQLASRFNVIVNWQAQLRAR